MPEKPAFDAENTYDSGMRVFSYIIGGIVAWGLIGLFLDNLFETQWLVLVGVLFGAVGGFYLTKVHGLTGSNPAKASVGHPAHDREEAEQ